MEYYLSLDVGTTSVKAALFAGAGAGAGALLGMCSKEYRLETPAPDRAELDPEIYWRASVECARGAVANAVRDAGVEPESIRSVGVCSQGETIILLDERGEPVRKAIVWLDMRASKEAKELDSILAGRNPTGQIELSASWPLSKFLWLTRNEPRSVERTRRLLLVEDYILFRLTGEQVGEYSLYTSSYMLDIRNKRWWDQALAAAGIRTELLSRLVEPGTMVGRLTGPAAAALGVSVECVAVTGAMDQTAAMAGAGSVLPGIATETTGAALVVSGTLGGYPERPVRTLALQYHAVPDHYLVTGWTPAGGMSLKWMKDELFPELRDAALEAGRDPYDLLTQAAGEVPIGCDGLTFLPFMGGPGTMRFDPALRGGFSGLTLSHTRGHLVRAVLEGLALVVELLLGEMEAIGTPYKEIRSLGGGAKSDLWCRIKANVTGRPVRRMSCPEAAALGTAMLQAVAAGEYGNLSEAADEMVESAGLFEPDPLAESAAAALRAEFAETVDRYRRI